MVDTAGLRESADPVERIIGIVRAWAQIAGADVLLFGIDLGRAKTAPTKPRPGSGRKWSVICCAARR